MRRDRATCFALLLCSACAESPPPPPDLIAHLERWSSGAVLAPIASRDRNEPREDRPGRTIDASDGIDLSEAEELCRILGPRSREARADAGVSAAIAENAGRASDPRLEFDLERILESVPRPWVLGAAIEFEIPLSDRLAREKDRSVAEHEVALASLDRATWEEIHALRADWIRRESIALRLAEETTFLSLLGEIATLADHLSDAGSIRRTDARLFSIEIVARKAEILALEAERDRLESAIKTRIGLSPVAPVVLARSPFPASIEHEDDRRIDELRERNLVVAVARARREASAQRLGEETARRIPDLAIGPGLGEDEGVDRALLGVSIPLPLWNRNRAAIETARARLAADDERLRLVLEEQVQFLARAERDLSRATLLRELIEREALPQVREQVVELRALADLGELSSLQILDALAREVATRRSWIDAREAELLATNSIAERVGPNRIRASDGDAGETP